MDKLEMLGNMLEEAQKAYNELPNQYTRGQVEGLAKAYRQAVNDLTDLTQPPVVLDYGQSPGPNISFQPNMQKYGVPPEHFNKKENFNREAEILENIYIILVDIKDILRANNNSLSAEAQEIFDLQQKTNKMEDIKKYWEEKLDESSKEETEDAHDAVRLHEMGHQTWNKTFGQRLQGNVQPQQPASYGSPERLAQLMQEQELLKEAISERIQSDTPADEEYIDPETGHTGRIRRIGQAINVDEEPEGVIERKTVEQWEKQPRVYTSPQFDDLEDLSPGQ